MLCGWRYGARLTASQMRAHFTICGNGRRPLTTGADGGNLKVKRGLRWRWGLGGAAPRLNGEVVARECAAWDAKKCDLADGLVRKKRSTIGLWRRQSMRIG
jgi:hypothetical protein